MQRVTFSGTIVDDATGEPINAYSMQWSEQFGRPDAPIRWATGVSTPASPQNGRFSYTGNGQSVAWLRILANGYLPEPVTPAPVPVPARVIDLVVRLKRGASARGIVLDYTGKPIPAAHLYLIGDGRYMPTVSTVDRYPGQTTTDAEGKFMISGLSGAEDERLAVVVPQLRSVVAVSPVFDRELEVRLPQPGRLDIAYDIPGDLPEATIRMDRKTDADLYRLIDDGRGPAPKVRNGQRLMLDSVAPGAYDIYRSKTLRMGGEGRGLVVDRRTFTIEPGKTQAIDFVRKTGQAIRGTVKGLDADDLEGAFITVRGDGATGEMNLANALVPLYDGLTVAKDGKFETAALLPGRYVLIVEAYRVRPPSNVFRTGIRLPDFQSIVPVEVTAEGSPPPVEVGLKPYERPPR